MYISKLKNAKHRQKAIKTLMFFEMGISVFLHQIIKNEIFS